MRIWRKSLSLHSTDPRGVTGSLSAGGGTTARASAGVLRPSRALSNAAAAARLLPSAGIHPPALSPEDADGLLRAVDGASVASLLARDGSPSPGCSRGGTASPSDAPTCPCGGDPLWLRGRSMAWSIVVMPLSPDGVAARCAGSWLKTSMALFDGFASPAGMALSPVLGTCRPRRIRALVGWMVVWCLEPR